MKNFIYKTRRLIRAFFGYVSLEKSFKERLKQAIALSLAYNYTREHMGFNEPHLNMSLLKSKQLTGGGDNKEALSAF